MYLNCTAFLFNMNFEFLTKILNYQQSIKWNYYSQTEI